MYFRLIFLYALSLNGCLTYDQDTFVDNYSQLFTLIDADTFGTLLEHFFPCERFVKFYKDTMEVGGQTLNFYLVGFFFSTIRLLGMKPLKREAKPQ